MGTSGSVCCTSYQVRCSAWRSAGRKFTLTSCIFSTIVILEPDPWRSTFIGFRRPVKCSSIIIYYSIKKKPWWAMTFYHHDHSSISIHFTRFFVNRGTLSLKRFLCVLVWFTNGERNDGNTIVFWQEDIWVEAREEWTWRCPPLLALLPCCLRQVPLAHNITRLLARIIDMVSELD